MDLSCAGQERFDGKRSGSGSPEDKIQILRLRVTRANNECSKRGRRNRLLDRGQNASKEGLHTKARIVK